MRKAGFNEKRWKPIFIGILAILIVFFGLMLYQQTAENHQEDIIMNDEGIDNSEDIEVSDVSSDIVTTIFVDVGGAVNISGLFALPAGSRVADAIEAAGGVTENAEIKYINRACVLADGDKLYIPTVNEVKDGTAPPSVGQGEVTVSSYSEPTSSLININTAGSDELQKLNGVGPAIAQKIIDYRDKRGGFKRIEDLMNVSGIGAKTFEKLSAYITV